MKVLLVNTSEMIGGAAIACNRLMQALNRYGGSARMIVRDRQTDSPLVRQLGGRWMLRMKFVWERLMIFLSNGLDYSSVFQVDIANAGTDICGYEEFREADVVHLHWTNQGFLSMRNLDSIMHSGKKVVVTMHDQWYFTGVCHYSADCSQYEVDCSDCKLVNGRLKRLAKRVFDRKKRIYEGADITFVGCSNWIAELARKSVLTRGHRVVSIPNAIDTALFCPGDKCALRRKRGWDEKKRYVMFGAQKITDERKGFRYFAEALNKIKNCNAELANDIIVLVVGGDGERVKELLPCPVIALSYIKDVQDMVETYGAADLYVTPSLQDNLPNTIVESMSCGVPCVGFCVGGIPEMIDHKVNGYVARYQDAEDFADGIMWALDECRYDDLSVQARRKAVETYSEEVVARKYMEVYG